MIVKLFMYWRQYDWEDEGKFVFVENDCYADKDYMFIRGVEVEIPNVAMPSRDQIARAKVAGLEEERKAILAETHKKVAAIDEKIRQLSALTYSPEVA